jgi:hypothetical protein
MVQTTDNFEQSKAESNGIQSYEKAWDKVEGFHEEESIRWQLSK